MKKAIKIIVGTLVAIVALVLVLVLTLPLWLGPVVKPTANAAVPKLTKTTFNLGHLSLNPYTGRFELGDLQLGNPEGYDEKQALTLNKLVVDVAMGTLGDEYVHVEEVTVDGVFVSYVSANGVNNFDQIQYNVAGGKEKYEAKKAEAKAKAEKEEAEQKKEEAPAEEDEASSKKLVIDKLVINDIKVKLGFVTLPVPSITLTDLGKKSNGITFAELGDQIMQAIMKSATAVGDGAKMLGNLVGEGAGEATKAAGKAVSAVGDGAKAAGEAVKNLGAGATDAVGSGAKAVGEGASKAVDAVGEGAKKAADALKSLF